MLALGEVISRAAGEEPAPTSALSRLPAPARVQGVEFGVSDQKAEPSTQLPWCCRCWARLLDPSQPGAHVLR